MVTIDICAKTRLILAGFAVLELTPLCLGQSPTFRAPQAFEVASVKPHDPSARRVEVREEPGGRLTMVNMTLLRIAQNAYGMRWYWIAGGPGWIDKDRFDIVAKGDGDVSRDQLMKMLKTLIEQIQLLPGHASVQTTERYLGTRQDLIHAPNDAIRLKVAI